MIRTFSDGQTIELGHGSTHPPGWTGQHGNVNRSWLRMNGGAWRPILGTRSTHHVRVFMEAAETAQEAWNAIFWEEEP